MGLIVDNNVISRVLVASNDQDYAVITEALFSSSAVGVKLYYGGKLRDEYCKNAKVSRLIAQLDRAGKAILIDTNVINNEVGVVLAIGIKSDDAHVLALARASSVRVLCSSDVDLIADFKNKSIIDKPRGKIFTKNNRRLLCSCR